MLENPDTELANGRRFRLSGQDLDVKGTLQAVGGDRFLIVATPDSHACALINQGAAVEEGEAVSPEEVQAERERALTQPAPVTDDTRVTDPPAPTPTDPPPAA